MIFLWWFRIFLFELLFFLCFSHSDTSRKSYNLVIGSIFCNEDHIMVEWLNHHYSEGVEHFVMVDNCPTLRNMDVLKPYISGGLVTLYTNDTKHVQDQLYNRYILRWVRKIRKVKWLVILDLDEFIYAPHHADITSVLELPVMNECDSVQVPWVHFGTSGLTVSPKSIVQGNTMRVDYNKHIPTNSKAITRAKRIWSLRTHSHVLKNSDGVRRMLCSKILTSHSAYNLPNISRHTNLDGRLTPEIIPLLELRINHYPLQSREYFFNVKAIRGDAGSVAKDGMRNETYFKKYDRNDYFDDELAKRRKARTMNALTGKLVK